MKRILDSYFFYLLFPVYSAFGTLALFFYLPSSYYQSLIAFLAILTLPVILFRRISGFHLAINSALERIHIDARQRQLLLAFSVFIMILSPLDLYFNGFKLLHPETYADLHGIGRYIRHFTILEWILIPIAFLMIKNKKIRYAFIGYALIYPVLIFDRNRLFCSWYVLIFFLLHYQKERSVKSQCFSAAILIGVCIFIFATMGFVRSGHHPFTIPSSSTTLESGKYPFKPVFMALPTSLQQVVLYVGTPLLNFATIEIAHYRSKLFLLSQWSPFSRDKYPLYPFLPVLRETFNVGTEFFPFLLYAGFSFVALMAMMMIGFFFFIAHLFNKYPSIFTLLFFLRISYCTLFMGFAPQFYIFYNLAFYLLIGALWCVSSLRPHDASKLVVKDSYA